MANNKLILRSIQSPWVTPFNDITTNSVLSWGDVDNNFIYLKGELIYSGFTSNNQLILQKINGSQITINGVGGGGSTTDVFVTGGTYNPLTGEAIFTNNTGGTFDVGGFFTGDSKSLQEVVNVGNTINNFGGNGDASIQSTNFVNNRTLYLNDDANPTIKIVDNLDGAHKLTIDIDTLTLNNTSYNWLDIINGEIFVTGGTYNPLNGEATFTNNSGGTFDVSGFLTGYTNYYTTGATLNDTILSFDRTDELSAYEVNLSSLNYGNKWVISSGTTVEVKENYQSFIYGDLYIQGTLLLNDNAQLVVLNGDIILSGGSISGNGTTLLVDLPMVDTYITGGTYSNGDLTLVDNFGDDVTINGFYTGSTGNYLPLSGGVMDDNAIIEFNNTSQLREGYNDFGGQGGISQICGLGYENNWQAGINHIFDNNGFIRESKYCFNTIPDNTFDSSSKFKVGSRWVLDNGDVYICSDDTVGSAVWYLEDNDTYVTGGTYISGGTIIFGYNTGGDFEVSGLTVDLTSQIDGLAEADEQTITLNLTTNKIELKETVAEATGGIRTFQGDFAISGGTLNLDTIGSGSPIINLGLDSSGFVVTGTTSIPFTGNTSGDCISDIYVSNVHSCSPLHINPNDEGNIYFGSTSGVTVDLTNHKLVVENIQITSGATDGYVLTSDASGNTSWLPLVKEKNALEYIFDKFSKDINSAEALDAALGNAFYLPKSTNVSYSLDSDIYLFTSSETFCNFMGDDILQNYNTCLGSSNVSNGFLTYLKGDLSSYFKINKPTSLSYYAGGSTLDCFESSISGYTSQITDNVYFMENEFNELINSGLWDYDGLYITSGETRQRFSEKGIIEYGSINGETQINKILTYIKDWSGRIYFDETFSDAVHRVSGDILIPNLGFSKLEILDRILDRGLLITKIKYAYNGYNSDYLLVTTAERFLQIFFSDGPEPGIPA